MHKLEEPLYRLLIVPLLAFLPASLAYGLACLEGDWRYLHNGVMRKQIMCNLEGVFGDQLSRTERDRIARDFFRRQSCQAIDEMRLAGSGRTLARLVEIRGIEHIEAALAAGKGAIVCIAHFGSFMSGVSLIGTRGLPITAVGDLKYKSDPRMPPIQRTFWRLSYEKLVARHLQRPNIEPGKGQVEAAIRMAEILRANEVISIAIDVAVPHQDHSRAVPINFLGRKILLLPGSVSIAQHIGSPVMALVVHRAADWRHQVLEISPPIPLDGDIATAFNRCVAIIEAPIRQNPAFWDYWGSSQSLVDLGMLAS